MDIVIAAIGTSNPVYEQTQAGAAALAVSILDLDPVQKRLLNYIYRVAGVDSRRSVLSDYCKVLGEFDFFPNSRLNPFPTTAMRMKVYEDNALTLSLAAIEDCLQAIPFFKKQDITHVITVSCTGMYAPGLDIDIIKSLGLNSDTNRTCINFMGCYGAFNALKIANYICMAEPSAKVLIVSVELCTIHFQDRADLSSLITKAIFSDGAAAAIVQAASPHSRQFIFKEFYSDVIPQTNLEIASRIGDQGFDIELSTDVPEIIKSGISEFYDKLLTKSQIALAKDDFYAIHPGGKKILKACEEGLGITAEDNRYAYDVLRNHGNMSSATVLFVLKSIMNDLKNSDNGKNIFSCAFGPGLTIESMLLKVRQSM
jgi:alpha-pyrone synthase